MTCFLFGHSGTPFGLEEQIEYTSEAYYQRGFRTFIVGNYGNFDRMARIALRKLKKTRPDICIQLLLPYHPINRPISVPEGFDGTYYPPGMETVPSRLCIIRANGYMAQNCDGCICYVAHPGNADKLQQKVSRRGIPVRNLAQVKE